MCRRSERGIALLGVVGALCALALVATTLATAAAVHRRRLADARDAVQADALARSAVATASVLLADHVRAGEPDTLRSPWAIPLGRQTVGPGWVEVRVQDEARRLDLDMPGAAPILERLLRGLDLDPRLADTLADWTDPDDVERPHGAERAWYRRRDPPLAPANAPLGSVGELTFVRGWDARALETVRPFVTVDGEAALNPNTAPPALLAAWLGDRQHADDVMARRAQGVIECDGLPHCTTRAQRYRVIVIAGADRTRREVEVVVGAAGGLTRVRSWRSAAGEVDG